MSRIAAFRRIAPRWTELGRALTAIVAIVAVIAATLPTAAHAYWRGGVFYGVAPIVPFYPAPVYVPPPVYYAPPPPVVYAPPGFVAPGAPPQQSAAGPSCYPGPYVCPLVNATPLGAPCSCPGNNGRVPGSVR